jgi:PAS domain S-box-containing protein
MRRVAGSGTTTDVSAHAGRVKGDLMARFKACIAVASCSALFAAGLAPALADDGAGGAVLAAAWIGAGLLAVAALVAFVYLRRRQRAFAEKSKQAAALEREWFQTTIASIGDGVISTDHNGRVVNMNPVAEALTGWTERSARGLPVTDVFKIVNEETRALVINPVEKVVEQGIAVGMASHALLIAKDGIERPIDDSAAPIRDGQGNVQGIIFVFRDVTAKRKAENTLRETSVFLKGIIASTREGIQTLDLEGRLLWMNPYGQHMMQIDNLEPLRYQSVDLDWPREAQVTMKEAVTKAKRGEVASFEAFYPTAKGVQKWWEVTVSPIVGARGEPIQLLMVSRNITERKRSEQSARFLADATEKLAELTDHTSTVQKIAGTVVPGIADWCAIDLLQGDGSYRRVAIAHAQPPSSVSQKPLTNYIAHPSPLHGISRVILTGQPTLVENISDTTVESLAQDDEQLHLLKKMGLKSYICVPLLLRGKVLGALTFASVGFRSSYDNTDLRFAQELAHHISVAVENARLYQALQEAGQRKDEFLATLAHELRNPLAPLRNGLEIMRKSRADAAVVEQVRSMMERQLTQMVRLVDDLLDVSRINSGKFELRRERTTLKGLVETALEAIRPALEAEHDLTVSLPEDDIFLNADPARLSQALINLLDNAAKYTPAGGHIWLTAQRVANTVTIVVKDSGIGISAAMLPKVFEVFTQADTSIERTRGGLGVGLTLVKRLVEMHDGNVEARSAGLGQGSSFIVRLPILPVGSRPLITVPPVQVAATGGGAARKRIVVVDDNVDAASTLATILKLMGHRVQIAHDGPQALTVIREHQPDLVFLDIGLPGMSGYEVAKQLRADPALGHLFIVALSGYGTDEDKQRSREAGFDQHVVKPVDPGDLEGIIKACP